MTYLEDQLTGAVRKFNEEIPKEARKIKVFMKSKSYDYDSDENIITASKGRWKKSTKTKYDAWVKKSSKVES